MAHPINATRMQTAPATRVSSTDANVPRSSGPHVRHPTPRGPAAISPATTTLSRHRLLHNAAVICLAPALILTNGEQAHAIGFKKDLGKARRNSGISKSDYLDLDISQYDIIETRTTTTNNAEGEPVQSTSQRPLTSLKYYDTVEGTKSAPVAAGDAVTVHFDCIFRKIDAVSTRSARLLGENRVIAEPFSFVAGSQLDAPRAITTDAGGGLFSGQSGPKPPQAVSYAVVGMKVGGKRSVLVPAVLGYGAKGEQEIPPNCPEFELQIELLSIGDEGN